MTAHIVLRLGSILFRTGPAVAKVLSPKLLPVRLRDRACTTEMGSKPNVVDTGYIMDLIERVCMVGSNRYCWRDYATSAKRLSRISY